MRNICCIPFCESMKPKKDKKYSFHEFPCALQTREKWIKVVSEEVMKNPRWQPSETTVLCCLHFREDDFREGCRVRRLKVSAVPSIFAPRSIKRPTIQKIEMPMQKWARKDDSYTNFNSAIACESDSEVEILGEYIQTEEKEEYILS